MSPGEVTAWQQSRMVQRVWGRTRREKGDCGIANSGESNYEGSGMLLSPPVDHDSLLGLGIRGIRHAWEPGAPKSPHFLGDSHLLKASKWCEVPRRCGVCLSGSSSGRISCWKSYREFSSIASADCFSARHADTNEF